MPQLRVSVLTAVALAIAFPVVASAGLIVTSAHRNTYVCSYTSFATQGCEEAPKTGTGPYASALSRHEVSIFATADASASQTSDIATSVSALSEFWGSGAADATFVFSPGAAGTGPLAQGSSSYSVSFALTQPYAYVLDGAFAAVTTDLDSTSQTFYRFVFAELINNQYVYLADLFGEGNDTDVLAGAGVLSAGNYILFAHARGSVHANPLVGSARANFLFDLDLTPVAEATPVPEPASMLLLGTGLLGAGVRRWRQRKA